MSPLFAERFIVNEEGEGGLMHFSDLDLMMYARKKLSGKRRFEGGTSLPDRMETMLEVVFKGV